MVKLLLQQSEPGIRQEEIEALLQNAQHSPVDANSSHESTHIPNIHMKCQLQDQVTQAQNQELQGLEDLQCG
ncbi:hypothetical protein PIB30_090536 [Stylosanthes scabra]|uniref:Uncharacterized protein n=1 Tax=Stylosanthes scabra TaxID=79078 RepID=A0ABU6ZT49_9FABA|nr:hypothetical protein [Stylosanthes scabra]